MDYFISHCKDPHSPTKISIPFKQWDIYIIYHINRSRISSIHQWTILILVLGGKDSNFRLEGKDLYLHMTCHSGDDDPTSTLRSNQPRKSKKTKDLTNGTLPGRIIPKTSHSLFVWWGVDFLEVRQLYIP